MKKAMQIGQTIISYDATNYTTIESVNNNIIQIDIIKNDDQSNACSIYNNAAIVWNIDVTALTISGANGLSIINL